MRRLFSVTLLFALLANVGGALAQRVPIDQVPMYGGMDRSAVPELRAADEKFISDVTTAFGSREKASRTWVEQGFKFYNSNDLAMAMRRFNQAWLLNPKNPETYWGFALVFQDQQQYCEALPLVDMAFANGPIQDGFLPDAGIIYAGCVAKNSSLSESVKQAYLKRVDELFEQAYVSPVVGKQYTLHNWARAMYGRGDYAAAWAKVKEYRRISGGEFDRKFIDLLSSKLQEPQ